MSNLDTDWRNNEWWDTWTHVRVTDLVQKSTSSIELTEGVRARIWCLSREWEALALHDSVGASREGITENFGGDIFQEIQTLTARALNSFRHDE